jgi:hypothetical protein
MGRITHIRFRLLRIPALLLPVLLPTVASAGWGNAIPVAGVVALAALLLGLSYWLPAVRRGRAKRPPLHS